MRLPAVALLALLSSCSRADDSARAAKGAAEVPRADTPRPLAADFVDPLADGTFVRRPGEPADSFVARVMPGGLEPAHPVIATDVWSPGDTALIAYYLTPINLDGGDTLHDGTGFAFLPVSAQRYRRVKIGDVGYNAGDPEIRSVFFANADAQPGPELIVIAAWSSYHVHVAATFYETFVYARRPGPGGDRFVHLEEISRKVSGTCDCDYGDGRRDTTSRFKTAAEVRAALRELGYW